MNDFEKSEIKLLSDCLRNVLPLAIKEVNEIRIPALELAWGRPFKLEFANENQKTVEIAKNYVRLVNNAISRLVSKEIPHFTEHTTDGSDYKLDSILIEDKNSFSDGNTWVGNGFNKTPIHLLKKFKCNEDGRIIEAFAMLVDLSECEGAWAPRNIETNRSVISFNNNDLDSIEIVYGNILKKTKKLQPIMVRI